MSVMPKWEVIGATVRGASHVRSNLQNQDAVRVELTGGERLPALLVVSDGHGSSKCLRSHEGSRLAVDIAIDELREFSEFAARERLPPAEIHRQAREQLPRRLWCKWREKVQQHFAENPFLDDELGRLEEATAVTVRELTARDGPFVAYGATLVAALLGQAEWSAGQATAAEKPSDLEPAIPDNGANRGNYLVCLQLGDGEILAISGDTHQVEQPIPADADLIANETTSLCQDEAWEKFRVSFRYLLEDRTPPLILLATDGYPNSFQTPEGFRQVAGDLLNLLERDSVEVVRNQLPGWLETASNQGSGDDVSVAILYCPRPPGEQGARATGDYEFAQEKTELVKRPLGPLLVQRFNQVQQVLRQVLQTARKYFVIAQRYFVVARRWFRRHPTVGLISAFVALLLAIYSVIVSGYLFDCQSS